MSQEDKKLELEVKLFVEDGIDYLEFNLGAKTHKLNLNLEDNQVDIKKMFIDLIPILKSNDVELNLEVQEGYQNTLLKEVAQSYVTDLNNELATVRTEILDNQEDSEN